MAGYQNTDKTDRYRKVQQRTVDNIPASDGRGFIQGARPHRPEAPSDRERSRGMVEDTD